MKISNLSPVPQQVGIVLPDGRTGTTRIMGRVRMLGLAPGAVVDPRWEAVNPGVIVKFAEATDVKLQVPTYADPVAKPAATASQPSAKE